MGAHLARFRLELIGPLRLLDHKGARIPVCTKRARIILAMLATAPSGERSRSWLQDRLWGMRDRAQAQASLRRELSNLRPVLNQDDHQLLNTDRETVALDLERIETDISDRNHVARSRGEFLEGIDLAHEEGFEDWLREERQALRDLRDAAEAFGTQQGTREALRVAAMIAERPKLAVLVEPQDLPHELSAVVEGIAYDLADRIARLRWLLLVGSPAGTLRSDSPSALERAVDVLGADYVLHCRIGETRTFQLALSEGGNHLLWSGRHMLGEPVQAGELKAIATDAVAALVMQIETVQLQRVRQRDIQQLNANELVWRARWHMRRLTRDDALKAEELLDRALKVRPKSAEMMLERGYTEAWKLWNLGAAAPPIEGLRRHVMEVRDLDPYDARAWLLLGILDMWLSRHDSAISLMREALALNPSLAFGYGHLGSCQSLASRPDEALPLIRMALHLNPLDTHNFHQFGELALANLMLDRPEQSIIEANHALARRPGYVYGHALKIAALWNAGDKAGAREAAAELLRIRPRYDPAALEWLPFKDRSWNARLRQAVASAIDYQESHVHAVR